MTVPPGATPLGDGVYVLGGEMHVDLAEFVVAAGGDPADPKDIYTAQRAIQKIARQQGIPTLEIPEDKP